MIEVAKRMTAQSATPSSTTPSKKRPALASLFVSRDATSREVFNFNPLWLQAGTRGVASRFTGDVG